MTLSLPRDLLGVQYEGTALSKRERAVLRLIARGYTGPEAATKLHVSPTTVKTQLRIARARLGARTTAHAIGIAVSLDLI
jgi:DNA-binding CsgD family transcriptional regulator